MKIAKNKPSSLKKNTKNRQKNGKNLEKNLSKMNNKKLQCLLDEYDDYCVGIKKKTKVKMSSFEKLETIMNPQILDAMKMQDKTDKMAKLALNLIKGKDLNVAGHSSKEWLLLSLGCIAQKMINIGYKPSDGTGTIIICPTREVAQQTFTVLKEILVGQSLSCCTLMDGASKTTEIVKTTKGQNIVVTTPIRLLEHMTSNEFFNFKPMMPTTLIVCELNRFIDLKLTEELKSILMRLKKKERQNILLSDLRSDESKQLEDLFLSEQHLRVTKNTEGKVPKRKIEHLYVISAREKRMVLLLNFLLKNKDKKGAIVFSTSKCAQFNQKLFKFMDLRVNTFIVHGQQSLDERSSYIEKFINAEQGILLCTSSVSMSEDLSSADWIIQYDPPENPSEYLNQLKCLRPSQRVYLFLSEEEREFLNFIKQNNGTIKELNVSCSNAKLNSFQTKVEKLVATQYALNIGAKEAFKDFIRSYHCHPLKDSFDFAKLDLKKVAKTFGCIVVPHIDLEGLPKKRKQLVECPVKPPRKPKKFRCLSK